MSDAAERVEAFGRAHGELLLDLASHAALPVVIDAALLHLVRVNYFLDPPDSLPYTAEAELLLSPLCREIADGLYLISAPERDVLLRRLVDLHGFARLKEVAGLLWEYGERQPPWATRPGLAEAQQLTAMNFLHPPGAAAWLAQAETDARHGTALDDRWLVAMRQEIEGRTTAVTVGTESEKPVIRMTAAHILQLARKLVETVAREDFETHLELSTDHRIYDFAPRDDPYMETVFTVLGALNHRAMLFEFLRYVYLYRVGSPDLRDLIARLCPEAANWEAARRDRPALVDLRDVLTRLYDFPDGVLDLAKRAGVSFGLRGKPERPGPMWRGLLETAWQANRIPAVLGVALSDYPEDPYLKEALIDYWVRLTPALRIENGTFEPAPPEWSVLEAHRAEIGAAISALCLFAVEGALAPGMGFMIGARTLLTHPSMTEGLKREGRAVLWLAFADTHSAWPIEFKAHLGMPPRRYDVVRAQVERVIRHDTIGFCAIIFSADDADAVPGPLELWTSPSEALVGRKVYTLGYPQVDPPRVDPKIVERIIGSANEVLRLQPGEVTDSGGEPPEITHNCFTVVGNGGSPLVDLETGLVLGLHYAGAYHPGPTGLKISKAIPIWRILEAMREAETEGKTTETTADEFPAERLAQAARAVCTIHLGPGRSLVGSGFLIGPDLVLTCHHVVRTTIETGRVSDLRCRFDEWEGGNVCAVDAVIAFSPMREDWRTPSAPGQLDYALLRLTFPVGNRFRWLPVAAGQPIPVAGRPLRIPTRTGRRPYVSLRAYVRGTDETGNALRYAIGSRVAGASGSPCLDVDLKVVAMHQADTDQETGRRVVAQGVLISAIARDLAEKGLGWSMRPAHGLITVMWRQEGTHVSAFGRCFAAALLRDAFKPERLTFAQLIDQTTAGLRGEGIQEIPDLKVSGAGMLDFPLIAGPGSGQRRALVMAANHFYDPFFPPLAAAEEQARLVAQALQTVGSFETTLLLGSEMTRAAVTDALQTMRAASADGDILLVYFAGHGALVTSPPNLVLSDSRAINLESMIPLQTLTEVRTERQAVIVIVDIGHGLAHEPSNTVEVGAGPRTARRGSANPKTKNKAKSAAKPRVSTTKAARRVKTKKKKKKKK
jgi:hypothetical protein